MTSSNEFIKESTSQKKIETLDNENSAHSSRYIEGRYIVVFNERWNRQKDELAREKMREFIDEFINEIDIDMNHITNTYESAIRGFSAR